MPVSPTGRHLTELDDRQAPPAPQEIVRVAHVAAQGLRELINQRAERAVGTGIDVGELVRQADTIAADRTAANDPARQAVTQVTRLCEMAMEIRRRRRKS